MKDFGKLIRTSVKVGALSLLLSLCLVCSLILPAVAGMPEGLTYLRNHQASDGGFCEPGGGSGQDGTTAWCIMALRAGGIDPNSVKRNGRSPVDFLATQSGNWKSVTDYERTLLAAAAAGADLTSFGGVNLIEKVRSFQRPAGNIGDAVNSNAFGMLALRAAGLEVPAGAVAWHKSAQNANGGWGNSPGAASNPDMTAASVMALRAAGVGAGDPSIISALNYLRSIQAQDGGFSFQAGVSDAAATAWCVQAIVAVGQDPSGAQWSKNGATPVSFLLSVQNPDGHFSWLPGRDMNPVWVTAYAVCALAGKPFPVAVAKSSPGQGGGTGNAESRGEASDLNVASSEVGADTSLQGAEGEDLNNKGIAEESLEFDDLEESREGKGIATIAWWIAAAVLILFLAGGGLWFMRRRCKAAAGPVTGE